MIERTKQSIEDENLMKETNLREKLTRLEAAKKRRE